MVGIETPPSSTDKGKQELGEQEMSEISSSLIGGEKPEEILKDDKNALMKLEVSLYTKFKYDAIFFFKKKALDSSQWLILQFYLYNRERTQNWILRNNLV